MPKKTLITTLIVQSVCWFSIIWLLLGNNEAQARNLLQIATPQPFMGSIYYGQKSVWQVFDHNFPNDGLENDFVVHYDGTQHDPATNTPAAPGATPVPGEWIRNGYGYDGHVGIDYGIIYRPVLAAPLGLLKRLAGLILLITEPVMAFMLS